MNCNCCPRNCDAERGSDKLGFCKSREGLYISSICAHRGEEPVLSGPHGICNIFFSHCNMQCIYCQNYQISDNRTDLSSSEMTLEQVLEQVEFILDRGAIGVGFVSPSHFVEQMRRIMQALTERGRNPIFVYNTNSYDKVETIASLEDEIDVYLPDLKYADDLLAKEYSNTPRYTETATKALKEMYRQKGANIDLDDSELVTRGMIIRHLVLPGHVENSKAVLRFIAEELSPDCYISLMAQYYPTQRVSNHPVLGRTIHPDEYNEVVDEFEQLGFHRGFVQKLSAPWSYKPDFIKDHPFEDQ